MRRLSAVSVLVVVLASAGIAVGGSKVKEAKAPKEKPVTVTGVLIDSKCYSMNPANRAQDHETPKGLMPQCAAACAKMGLPVALLTDEGDVVILVAPAASFADHMTRLARATGVKVYGNSLRPDKVEVRGEDGKWAEISIATMM